MLLSDHKKATEIDHQIQALHAQLTSLYETKLTLQNNTVEQPHQTTMNTADWQVIVYAQLKAQWAVKGVKVPSLASLRSKLQKAQRILADINAEQTYAGMFDVMLVPPTSVYGDAQIVRDQGAERTASNGKNWKLFVVYQPKQGLVIADQVSFIEAGQMKIADYAMPGLTLSQYEVFTQLKQDVCDEGSWSVLPAEMRAPFTVLCVGYIGDAYHAVADDTRSLIGDNRFRPALEVK